MSKTKDRLVGIDLCRGLAAFAVILVHSGDETWGLPISNQAIQFRYLFYYAVPFFLAASFYLGTKRSPLVVDRIFWQKKLRRIIIPYLLWSIFYVISKTIIFGLGDQTDRVQDLLSDPLAIIFFGAASYHLYFIPLLFAGTILFSLANYVSKLSNSIVWLTVCSIISIVAYQLLIYTHNDFNLGTYTAFNHLLSQISLDSISYQPFRIFLVNLSWIVRCLPYFFIALLINHILKNYDYQWLDEKETVCAIFLFFLLIDIVGNRYLPTALNEITIAYSFLLFGITISRHIQDRNYLINNLGLCSFGIYLFHPFIKSAVDVVLINLFPQLTQNVSIFSMLLYSIPSFILSWAFVSLMHKSKFSSRYI